MYLMRRGIGEAPPAWMKLQSCETHCQIHNGMNAGEFLQVTRHDAQMASNSKPWLLGVRINLSLRKPSSHGLNSAEMRYLETTSARTSLMSRLPKCWPRHFLAPAP